MAGNNTFSKPVLKMIIVFVILIVAAFFFRSHLEAKNVDVNMILTGNLILFVLGVFTLNRSLKAINNTNPHVFVRSFYSGFLIRLAVVAVAAFLYIYSKNGQVSRESLFLFMGLYAIYSIIEVSALRKVLKEKSNA